MLIGWSTSAYSTSVRRLNVAAAAAGSPVVWTTRALSPWSVPPSRAPPGSARLGVAPGLNLTMTWPPAAEAGAVISSAATSASSAILRKGA